MPANSIRHGLYLKPGSTHNQDDSSIPIGALNRKFPNYVNSSHNTTLNLPGGYNRRVVTIGGWLQSACGYNRRVVTFGGWSPSVCVCSGRRPCQSPPATGRGSRVTAPSHSASSCEYRPVWHRGPLAVAPSVPRRPTS